ncbi:MAG: ABC transporter substrate-binding protein [Chloroflexota bacterium]
MLTTSFRFAARAVGAGTLAIVLAACSGSSTPSAPSAATAAAPTDAPASQAATAPATTAPSTAAGAPVLRVGQLGSTKVIEALLTAAGEDKNLPYTIEWSLYPGGGPGFLEAAAGGNVDVGSMADTPPIFAQANGVPVKVVAAKQLPATVSTVELFAAADSPINSVADLKGRKVAITPGTILQYTVIRALEKAGLAYSDVVAVNLSPADALTAFQAGDVEVIAALDPQRAIIEASGAKRIGDGVGVTAGLSYVVATQKALDDPAIAADIADYLPRLVRAEAWADANPDAWEAIYQKLTNLPAPVAKSVVLHDDAAYRPLDADVTAAQQLQADTYLKFGLLKARLDVSTEFDSRFNDLVAGATK